MIDVLWTVAVVAHIALLGTWLGSMAYSLLVVQPRAARFFAADDDTHEAFLVTLGAGNRRPVLAILAGLAITGAVTVALGTTGATRGVLYGVEAIAVLTAAAVFARVSWQLWPRRVFALPDERPAHRAALRRHALAMVGLVGLAFVAAVTAAVRP